MSVLKYILIYLMVFFHLLASGQEEELKATMTEALLNVIVVTMAGVPSEGDFITFIDPDNGKKFSGVTKEDGTFKILIPKGKKYEVQYKGFEGEKNYTELEIPEFDGYLNFDFTIKYELPKVYTLENVYFDTGKSTIRPASYPSLNNLAELMSFKKKMKIEIAGHTDDVGEVDANQKLSEARANSVRNFLLKKGISPENVIAKGYGESHPIASNDTPEGKQKNRRTEVRILSQ